MLILNVNIKMKKGEKVWIRIYGNNGYFVYGSGEWFFFFGVKL